MFGKQHTGSRFSLLLGMFFLFINLLSVAAAVLKFADGPGQSVPRQLSSEVPRSGESEESQHLPTASYVSQIQHISLRRQSERHVVTRFFASRTETEKLSDHQHHFITAAVLLPVPGYYGFLFRHTLF